VNTARVLVIIAATVIGPISGRTSLHAQSTGQTVAVEGDDKPWNQGVSVANRRAARDLFLEGNRLFKMPLFGRAAEQYTAALGKWKHPAFYFNLAIAQLNLSLDAEAHDNLAQAVQHGAELFDPELFHEAKKQLQDLERQLGRILITCQTEGAEVTLDGVPLFTAPGRHERWVKAKAHEVTARRSDYMSEAKRVTVASGELKSLDLKLITLSEAEAGSRRWATWKPWAVIAAGGVVAASAGVFHVLSSRDFTRYDDGFQKLRCAQGVHPPGCPEADPAVPELSDLNARLKRARQERAIATGGYIAGGSLVAAGLVLLYLNRPRLVEQSETSSPFSGVSVAPTISSDLLGISVNVTH